MNRSTRLTLVVAQILAGGLTVGCSSLNDEACLAVELDEECPSVAEAQEELEGRRTCESPVREVTRVGELVSSAEVDDTGIPRPESSGSHIACCYEAAYKVHGGQSCVVGRPLRIDGEVSLAGVTERCDWVAALELERRALSPVARAALAAHWQADAELEHASVAAFARVTLELMALGAPADLLARTAEAQADEIRHAKECFALASAYAGRAIGPGMLGMPPLRPPSLAQFAVETFEEGCMGETLAVCRAAAQLRDATEPEVRRVLQGIVEDESRHAALAWDIVAWALTQGGAEVRAALSAAVERARLPSAGTLGTMHTAAYGLPASVQDALEVGFYEVIRPTVCELLAA